jgi:tetratricopeptide (TPR) repeat protein
MPAQPVAIEPTPAGVAIAELPAAEAPAIEEAPRRNVVQPANRDRGIRRKHDDGSPPSTAAAGSASARPAGAGAGLPRAAVAEAPAVGRAVQGGSGDAPASSAESKTGEPKTGEPKTAEPKIAESKIAEPKIGESKIGVAALASGHGARELIGEGEKLLAQGDTAEACRRGEDAKKAAPGLASVYKFLGKCYMRAGNVVAAKDSYRRYLELAPNAPDAVFIESMIK